MATSVKVIKVLELVSHTFSRVERVQLNDGSIAIRKTFEPTGTIAEKQDLAKLRLRFIREVKVQSTLPNEHFVPVIHFNVDSDAPWFLMPVADGNFTTAIQTARESGAVPMDAVRQIADALDKLHSLGIAHRDLKPQNILLHEDTWKLSDFGLVTPLDGLTQKLTSVHSAWGTASYCAPEQVKDFAHAGPPADIYALGCVLHDMLGTTMRVPYQQHTCPGPFGVVIEKCTELEPKKRFKSAIAVHDALVVLSTQPSTASQGPVSAGVTDWAKELEDVAEWDASKLEAFTRFVSEQTRSVDKWALLKDIDQEKIHALLAIDEEWWSRLGHEYCTWVREGSFDFDFCDVLVRRLEEFYSMGNVALKAAAVVACACLGADHNRWFVMGRVLHLCGHGMDMAVAERVVIEIIADDLYDRFEKCANRISQTIEAYHPRIAEILK